MKKYLPYILLVIALLGFGISTYFFIMSIKDLKAQLTMKDDAIREEQLRIDALSTEIRKHETLVVQLQDSVRTIKSKVIVKEVERIKYLPVDSGVVFLHDNLLEHGEMTDPTDTVYPAIVSLGSDTVVSISGNNLKDVNSIIVKYEWGQVENRLLGEALYEDSIMLEMKDSIILGKDIIISKQDSIFNQNMKLMEKQIRRDKAIAGTVGGAIGALTVATVVLGIILKKE